MDYLKLLSDYQISRSDMLKQKPKKQESDSEVRGPYSPFLTREQTKRILRKKRFNQYAANCTYAMEQLGLRFGEKVDPKYLKNLSSREISVFTMREDRFGFEQIAEQLKIENKDAIAIFERAYRKITKNIIEELKKEKEKYSRI